MFDLLVKAWNFENLPPGARAFVKFLMTAVRGAAYTAILAAYSYATSYHPSTKDAVIMVGLAFFVESLLVSAGKWVSAKYDPQVGQVVQQIAPQAAQAVLDAGRRNDPHVPLTMPDLSIPETETPTLVIPVANASDPSWLVPTSTTA